MNLFNTEHLGFALNLIWDDIDVDVVRSGFERTPERNCRRRTGHANPEVFRCIYRGDESAIFKLNDIGFQDNLLFSNLLFALFFQSSSLVT